MSRLLLILLLVAALGTGYWLMMDKEPEQNLKKIDIDESHLALQADVGVDLSLSGVELTHGEEGRMQWKLTADKARYLEDKGLISLEGPRIEYRTYQDPHSIIVTAEKGLVDQENRNAELWSGLEGTYGDNVIHAERLEYTGQDKILLITGNVVLEGPRWRCETGRMRFILEDNVLVMEQGVRAEVYTDLSLPPVTEEQ